MLFNIKTIDKKCFDNFTSQEEKVLKAVYGILGSPKYSISKLAKLLRISEQEVNNTLESAEEKLRGNFESNFTFWNKSMMSKSVMQYSVEVKMNKHLS